MTTGTVALSVVDPLDTSPILTLTASPSMVVPPSDPPTTTRPGTALSLVADWLGAVTLAAPPLDARPLDAPPIPPPPWAEGATGLAFEGRGRQQLKGLERELELFVADLSA